MKTVYLAGPIAGLHYDCAADWRNVAVEILAEHCISGISPLRGKSYLRKLPEITGDCYGHLGPLSSSRGVMTRDHFDTARCDVILVNLLGATKVSIGTCMEVAWAWQNRTPVVCCMETSGNPHEHLMFSEALGYRVSTLEDALHLVVDILC